VVGTTLGTLLQPGWLVFVFVWSFAVLSAAQLTIRLIMAYSVRTTLVGAAVLTVATLFVAAISDAVQGPQASLATRLGLAPLSMLLMALAGASVARWVLKIRRLRGQLIAGLMVGLLDPHLFTLL
jgi:hypothetical protein